MNPQDFIADVEAALHLLEATSGAVRLTDDYQELVFSQALADIRFARLCAQEEARSLTVHVGAN